MINSSGKIVAEKRRVGYNEGMLEKLREKLGEGMRENESLAKHTNFRIGGPARYFFEAKNAAEIEWAVDAAAEVGVLVFVLGSGSNVLVSDAGFDGLVIKMANREVVIDGDKIIADAGAPLALVANKAAEAGLAGLEWAATVPGTVGGAVRGNAGCFGGEMKDVVARVEVLAPDSLLNHSIELESGGGGRWRRIELTKVECGFGYRESVFKKMNPAPIILSVTLRLRKEDPAVCAARVKEFLQTRAASQPLATATAGCMFKNFEFKDREDIAKLEARAPIPKEFMATKRIPAGWIIDQLGLKGHKIGQAQISEQHANFFLNLGGATADEMVQLIALAKTRARNEFGIQLQEEVQYVGF